MKLSFKTRKLQQTLTSDKGLAKSYGTLAKKIRQRMQQLESAENLWAISRLPALRLHQHMGDGMGTWSIDVQQNWRILFTLDHDPIPQLEDGGTDMKAITSIFIESVKDPH